MTKTSQEYFQNIITQLQAKEEVSQLKLQVQEEHELRSVTESCLIENSITWNRVKALATDTDSICHDVEQNVLRIRQCQRELKKRVGMTSQACLTGSVQHNSLAAALKEGLQLEDNDEDVPTEIRQLSTQQLLQHLGAITGDVEQLIAKATVHTSSLLDISPSSVPGYS
ncbi:hypothetical protein LSH36_282g02018 [Paralvinella palmiformis]|uniref:Uncharacterized protein n=1 Tax=Paralvinella palmiformis TaxID=53620 RepID=A0AAD9N1N8_9ANNE|nr:hypothetical protein LSH36_282g02018 [Paralvinella palmiformis]